MRIFVAILFGFSLLFSASARADNHKPNFDLEKKIAYQQGQFGGLYARCGKDKELTVIGGSLDQWRVETFNGYQGSTDERHVLEVLFNKAAEDVKTDANACQEWIEQAAATWRSIAFLTRNGVPQSSQ